MGVTLSLNNYAPFGMTFSLVVNRKKNDGVLLVSEKMDKTAIPLWVPSNIDRGSGTENQSGWAITMWVMMQ